MTARSFAWFLAAAVLSCRPAAAADDSKASWPGWRGKDRSALTSETGLLKEWPKGGPKLLWTFDAAGYGYGEPAIVGEELYILGKDDQGEFIKRLNLDGKELARAKLDDGANKYLTGWGGGPRSTPTVDGDLILALSSDGRLVCYDRSSLSEKWSKSLVKDLGSSTKVKPAWWGYSESPLVDGDKVLVTPGGKNCVVALNKNTGATIWMSTGVEDDQQYSSLVPMTVDGKKMYVTQTMQNLIGVDGESGKLLWKSNGIPRKTAVIPTAVISGNRVYATAGYGAGCECVDIERSGDSFTAKKVYANKNMQNHHGGVILLDGYVYGHSGMSSGNPWVCQKLADGEIASKLDGRKVGKGSIAYADGRFYLFEEKVGGACVLVDASPKEWSEHGRFKLPKNTSLQRGSQKSGLVWTHPVVVGGRLYLRDLDLLFCYDVKAK